MTNEKSKTMKKYQILLSFSVILLLLISIPTKSHAIANVQNDSTNILLLSNDSKLRHFLKKSFYAFEKDDDVAIKTTNKRKIKGVITKIEADKIYISTENDGTKPVDIQDIKTIKRYKERHPFFGAIAQGFGIFLLIIGILGLIIMIGSYINLDTGSNFFPILGSSSFVALILFVGYKLLESSEKRLSPRRKFRIGKKWNAEIRDLNNTKNYKSSEKF